MKVLFALLTLFGLVMPHPVPSIKRCLPGVPFDAPLLHIFTKATTEIASHNVSKLYSHNSLSIYIQALHKLCMRWSVIIGSVITGKARH